MVDFQSRDTRRAPTTDDESDTEAEDDRPTDDGGAADEQPPDDDRAEAADEGGHDAATGADSGADGTATEADTSTDTSGGVSDEQDSLDETDTTNPTPDDPLAGPTAPSDSESGDETTDDPLTDPTTQAETESGDETTDEPLADPTDRTDTGTGTESGDETPDEPLADPTDQTDTESSDGMVAEPDAVEPDRSVAVAVVTVGEVGEDVEARVATRFESAGHTVAVRERLRGDYDTVQQVTDRLVDRDDVDVVVTAGGVGIKADEVTIEAVHPLLEKALPGFGEAFRSLLFETIGTGIVAVRTAAGVANGTLVFCLPGDPAASAMAVEEILVTEAPELITHLSE